MPVAFTLARGGRVLPTVTLHLLTTALPAAGPLDPATLGTVRWVVGAVLPYPLASLASEAASARLTAGWPADAPGGLVRLLRLLLDGRYGLDALLTARTESLSANATLTTGELVRVWSAVPDLADWRTATLLWTGGGLLALSASASRPGERRRA